MLNRFDGILEAFCATYSLNDGPQMRDFGCDLLLNKGAPVEYGDDQAWDMDRLAKLGFNQDGDCQLIIAVLKFTRMLLEHCGNRSIYASSAHLNDLLNSAYLNVVYATLEVGVELAQRYQASVKRMTSPSRQVSNALLANHYNIELEKVQHLAQSFVKTPIAKFSDHPPTTPASTGKGKDKSSHGAAHKNVASMYANDLVSIAAPGQVDEGRWNGWGDVKVIYYPKSTATETIVPEVPERGASGSGSSSMPTTPTPLRRSSTMPSHPSRGSRHSGDDSPSHPRTPAANHEVAPQPSHKSVEIPQSAVVSTSIYELLSRCPADIPKMAKYEFLNRLRTSKALLGASETRQQALAVRLLAITNLAYIHAEPTFIEKVLKQDNDEPRRYQLVYQLAELIHPSADGTNCVPLWLQSISLGLLEAVSNLPAKYPDVLSALNANVNHGVLLYVLRKAVAGMREDPEDEDDDRTTKADEWRNNLFSLTLHMAMGSRVGQEMISAGLMDILVEIINLRSKVASRYHSMMLALLDGLIYGYQGAFQSFSGASGLDSIAQLTVDAVAESKALAESGHGTRPELHSQVVDYRIPFCQQQTLKWLLKFLHHVMSNSYSYGGNADRLLRNLVDNSQLLGSIRLIIENKELFGAVVWTNAVTLLSDFLNNDPTSFAAISESGMIKTFLETLTGRSVAAEPAPEHASGERADDEDGEPSSPIDPDESVTFEPDLRPHPPTQVMLETPRDGRLANGILASSEAMSIIPVVLNSICLNNTGMKTVASSRALESYLEIFESPEHIRCMEADPDLPTAIGSCFDELARHHPALRPAISNAMLDMIARIVFMAQNKAVTEGWGAKLLISDPEGKSVTADETLLNKSGSLDASRKGKGKAPVGDLDVEMADVSDRPAESSTSNAAAAAAATGGGLSAEATPEQAITPYIRAVSSFFAHVMTNSSLKSSYIRHGGIELLLELSEAPSLPHDFGESTASRTLSQVVSQLIESSPIIGLPSLLNRLQAAIDTLEPLVKREGSSPFFAPFLIPDFSLATEAGEWDHGVVRKVEGGTRVIKALLNAQNLIKVLYQSFPYSSRQGTSTLPLVNVFDYYIRLIKSLGPLLRNTLSEEMSIANLVPHHWSGRKQPPAIQESADDSTQSAAAVASTGAAENVDGEEVRPTGGLSDSAVLRAGEESMSQTKKPSDEELSSPQYLNYQTLRVLLHSLMPTTFPFFQTIGKALVPRRERDNFIRAHHMAIAEALAETILEQLKPSEKETTMKDLHYWIVMLHTVHEMLVDPTRQSDRTTVQIILPVLIAFKEQGGIEALNTMVQQFADDICKDPADSDEESKGKLAAIGMKKILDLYALVVHGRNIVDSMGQINLYPRSADRRPDVQIGPQLVVELRMAILPVVSKLWESPLVEKSSAQVLNKIVDILKTIAGADQEAYAQRKSDQPAPPLIFKRAPVPFNWAAFVDMTKSLSRKYEPALAQEAVYRANGKADDATEYCRAHQENMAGKRNPIPEEDAFKDVPTPKSRSSSSQTPAFPLPDLGIAPDPMALDSLMPEDSMPEIDRLIGDALGEAVLEDLDDRSSVDSDDDDDDGDRASEHSGPSAPASGAIAAPVEAGSSSGTAPAPEGRSQVTKDELDEQRANLRKDLIDRCLEVIRAHPDSVFEVSELIQTSLLKPENEEKRAEVGDILSNALLSFASDDEDVKKSNGPSIAAYAHLLALLLQDRSFYKTTVNTLKDNMDECLKFLRLSPSSTSEELPPWIPYVLLVFEIMLSDDEQPVEVRWKVPANDDEPFEEPRWEEREANLSFEDRSSLVEAVLDILPRIGKEGPLAISVLRILVILTRDRSVAKALGERKNLQRLFVMAKQLCGAESGHLKDSRISRSMLIILRHIIEDEDTIRQLMQSEIRTYMESTQRGSRSHDIPNYLRHLSHVALRSPKLFIEVTTEMVKLTRWAPPNPGEGLPRQVALTLKEPNSPILPPAAPKDASVEPTVQATEDLTINDVKPSTESGDKEMAGVPRTPAQELKRPILENPDGVIHFLLCELLNYKEVDDKDTSQQPAKETKPGGTDPSTSLASTPEATPVPNPEDSKDKKAAKPVFKAEEHPIFVYRCFLLHCLAELLQSYNRTKVEFINFKRSAPVQTNTPIKPRASVLNYLLNDVLCLSSLSAGLDSVALKKKAATANQAHLVLVALVTKTGEKPFDRRRGEFEYDDEPDLLFVRRFVLDTVLKAYKDAATPAEPFDIRYAKMLCLAELMSQMIGEKDKDPPNPRGTDPAAIRSQKQLKRLMYEKGYLAALTASIADIDLTFPNVKRTVKYILRVLRTLSKTAIQLSQADLITSAATDNAEDEIASASSLSDIDDDREETPDLYRNSTLGMLEPGREEDDFTDDSEDGNDLLARPYQYSPRPSIC